MRKPYGFKRSFNRTFTLEGSPTGWWVSENQFGIDQGPVVLMVENYRTGLIWGIIRRCPYIIAGLRRAGSRAAGCSEESSGTTFLRLDGTVGTTDKDGLVPNLLAAEITARTGS